MTSENFYRDLPPTPIQTGMCDVAHHHAVPDDWSVAIVDIIGSTKAVAEGRYKDVNIASSCAIIAVLNRVGREQICYIYGGDGATFLFPSFLSFDIASALHGTREMVMASFNLDMRVGIVDVAELKIKGADIRIARVEAKPGVFQAALSGSGAALAEKLIKDPVLGKQYGVEFLFDAEALRKIPASFEGFECRWEPLKSRNGVDLCLLIAARMESEQDNIALYQSILGKIVEICGPEEAWRPVSAEQLDVSLNSAPLHGETKVRTFGEGRAARFAYWRHITLMTWAGWFCLRFGKKAGSFDGRTYRDETVKHSDFMKFENALKLVMDVSTEKKDALVSYLQALHREKKIFYGMHSTQAALMTCLVFGYENDHFHFIDGADGGYTLAAKMLKAQMKEDLLDDQHGLGRARHDHAA